MRPSSVLSPGRAAGGFAARAATQVALVSPHSELVTHADDSASPTLPAAALSSAEDATQDAGGVAMAVCLAVLVAMVVVRFGLVRQRWFELRRSARRATSEVLVTRARAPDPPDLFVLSVQRC